MQSRTWRLGHRWLGAVAALFLCWAGATGVLVAASEFFGADEAERERLRAMTSAVTTAAAPAAFAEPLQRALATVAALAPGAPIDAVELRWKADPPRVVVRTGKPGGGEDQRFVCEAATGKLLEQSADADKPLLYRLHSGEAFGDGGLVAAMVWGLALVLLSVSGAVLYGQMRRPGLVGWRRFFW